MVFIINNKKYNTDNMELISKKINKWYSFNSAFGPNFGKVYNCTLWQSKKNNWLLVRKDDFGHAGEALKEDEAKELLLKNDYESYEKIYGELEEA